MADNADNSENTCPKLMVKGYVHSEQETTPPNTRPKPPRRSAKKDLTILLQNKNEESVQEESPLIQGNSKKPPRTVDSFGDPITQNLANLLVQDFYHVFKDELTKQLISKTGKAFTQIDVIEAIDLVTKFIPFKVTFSKEVLMTLLSQPNCAGIKSYFCMGLPEDTNDKEKSNNSELPDDRKPSLVLVGVDINDNDLKTNRNPNEPYSIIYIEGINDDVCYDKENNTSENKLLAKAQDQKTLAYEVGGTDNVQSFYNKFREKHQHTQNAG